MAIKTQINKIKIFYFLYYLKYQVLLPNNNN